MTNLLHLLAENMCKSHERITAMKVNIPHVTHKMMNSEISVRGLNDLGYLFQAFLLGSRAVISLISFSQKDLFSFTRSK